jgi:threonine aldolase
MGGGMRQVGVLAAAGLYALDHHVARLADDHVRAARLARAVAELPAFRLDPASVQTNIVIAELAEGWDRDEVLRRLEAEGVLAGEMGPGRVRFVTHLDVDDAGLEHAIGVVRHVGSKPA